MYTPDTNQFIPDPSQGLARAATILQGTFTGASFPVGARLFSIAQTLAYDQKSPLRDPIVVVELSTDEYLYFIRGVFQIPPAEDGLLCRVPISGKDFIKKHFRDVRQRDPAKSFTLFCDKLNCAILNLYLRYITAPERSLDNKTRTCLLDAICPDHLDVSEFRDHLPAGATAREAMAFLHILIQRCARDFVGRLCKYPI